MGAARVSSCAAWSFPSLVDFENKALSTPYLFLGNGGSLATFSFDVTGFLGRKLALLLFAFAASLLVFMVSLVRLPKILLDLFVVGLEPKRAERLNGLGLSASALDVPSCCRSLSSFPASTFSTSLRNVRGGSGAFVFPWCCSWDISEVGVSGAVGRS